jgi:hypothetical protein
MVRKAGGSGGGGEKLPKNCFERKWVIFMEVRFGLGRGGEIEKCSPEG